MHSFSCSGRENACEKVSYMFLRKELPVRLANTMREVGLLPSKMLNQPSVQLVQSWWEAGLNKAMMVISVNPLFPIAHLYTIVNHLTTVQDIVEYTLE